MQYAGLGIKFAASILVFVFAGQWLDRKVSSTPLFTVLGAFLGFGGTMWWLIRRLKADEDQK